MPEPLPIFGPELVGINSPENPRLMEGTNRQSQLKIFPFGPFFALAQVWGNRSPRLPKFCPINPARELQLLLNGPLENRPSIFSPNGFLLDHHGPLIRFHLKLTRTNPPLLPMAPPIQEILTDIGIPWPKYQTPYQFQTQR